MFPYVLLLLLITGQLHAIKIAVVSLAAGESYREAVHPGIANKQAYCEEHGYEFVCFAESLDPTRHPAWSKIPAVEQVLSHYDWVFWSDADSLIMNFQIPLEEFIEDSYFFIASKELSGMVNSGEFLIKNEPISFQFLKEIYQPELQQLGFYEQGAVNVLLAKPPYSNRALFLHQRAMNAIWGEQWGEGCREAHYHTGDFIIHFMGANEKLAFYMHSLSEYLARMDSQIRTIRSDHLHKKY